MATKADSINEESQTNICENMIIVDILLDARNILRRGGEEAEHLRETIRNLKVDIDAKNEAAS